MQILFNELKEFIDELNAEYASCGKVFGGKPPILRITGMTKSTKILPLRHLYLCATIVNMRGELLRLERYCGDIWNGPGDEKVKDKYEELRLELVAAATGLGLETRAGVIEADNK